MSFNNIINQLVQDEENPSHCLRNASSYWKDDTCRFENSSYVQRTGRRKTDCQIPLEMGAERSNLWILYFTRGAQHVEQNNHVIETKIQLEISRVRESAPVELCRQQLPALSAVQDACPH